MRVWRSTLCIKVTVRVGEAGSGASVVRWLEKRETNSLHNIQNTKKPISEPLTGCLNAVGNAETRK